MKLLAIESSGMTAAAALLTDGVLTAEFATNNKKTHSQTLLPMIDRILQASDVKPMELDAIAISAGPGSFTGLRIGAGTAKGLGQAVGCPLIAVPTLDAMAFQCFGFPGVICAVMDARNNHLFAGAYRFAGDKLVTVIPAAHRDAAEFLAETAALGERTMFVGDGAAVQEKKIRELLPEAVFAPTFMNRQRAAAVGALGYQLFLEGVTVTAADFAPEYMKETSAEANRRAKEQA